MNFTSTFIKRPVATILLSIGLMLAGIVAYIQLPVSALPNVDIPVIVVIAGRPGADPAIMASSIAAPLERHLGEIGGVSEINSVSSQGSTVIVVVFDFGRDIEAAAHDVQSAINAATADLPTDLPIRPYYQKINPASSPILTLALSSDTLSAASVYDAADTVLKQRLSQIEGVGQVEITGGQSPSVRVQIDPGAIRAAGLSAQDVLTAIRHANVTQPVGAISGPTRREQIRINGQISSVTDYGNLVLKAKNGAALRLSDVAHVIDGPTNVRLAAWNGRKPAVILEISKVAGANVIDTVNHITAAMPQLKRWMPPGIAFTVLDDTTDTIRSSTNHVQETILITGALVLLTVMLFLRRVGPTFAAAVSVPLSIAGTLAGMWALGFSLNNYSLMAITISVGFVVDDAIVMIENITRLREQGVAPMQAALLGARQIGFTVMSISVSLVAVFIPIMFMAGILGRVLHEFAFTLTLAIATSAVVSLTLTPMVCARLPPDQPPTGWLGRVDRAIERGFAAILSYYMRTLDWCLVHRRVLLAVTIGTVVLTFFLYGAVPKGFLTEQDTGLIEAQTIASTDISFAELSRLQQKVVDIILTDPAVKAVGSNVGIAYGFDTANRGTITISLKPLAQRDARAKAIIARLQARLAGIAGIKTVMYAAQDLRGGGRKGGAQYQFLLLDSDVEELRVWSSKIALAMKADKTYADVTSDQDGASPSVRVTVDRAAASRLQVSVAAVDNALNNALSQRQISTIYGERNQYRVVVETLPWLHSDPRYLDHIYVGANDGTQVPLGSVTRTQYATAPLSVTHQNGMPAAELSFNLPTGVALGTAEDRVQALVADMHPPAGLRTDFSGNAKWLQQSLASEPALIAAALLSIYIVLGILYESLIHPITILSSLPSAGLGALLAVLVTGTEFAIMSLIGIVLLMGIVKKNAIMLVDFALEAEREHGMTPLDAIRAACLARFRPITMTTMAAICGAVPLAIAWGTGAEVRRPLGIAIVGGLIVSQMLTVYTTPVVYLMLERRVRTPRTRIVHAPAE